MTPCNHCSAQASTVMVTGMGAWFLCRRHDANARAQSLVVPEGGCAGWVIVEDLKVTA